METTKKQLFTAVAMLLVAALALGTATYAWFMNNAKVEVDQMNFQATASKSLTIASQNVDTSYKTVLTMADYDGTNGPLVTWGGILKPASAVSENLDIAGTTANKFFYGSETDGDAMYTTFTAVTAENSGTYVRTFPIWFKSSENMKVYLATSTAITASGGAVADATAAAISKALRVAIVTADGSGVIFDGESGVPAGLTVGAVTGSRINTKLIGGTISEGQALKSASNAVNQDAKYFGDYAATAVDENGYATAAGVNGKTALLSLTANEAKQVQVYIWLEGCDADCVNYISSNDFGLKLQFVGGPSA